METRVIFLLLADAILIVHFLFVLFVILGLLLVLAGKLRGWYWVRNFWFRVTHLAAIGFVVIQSWLGAICPLTLWEMQLRAQAGDSTYQGAFIAHWVQQLLYYQAPGWVFALIYTLFGCLVVISWLWVRPSR